MSAGSKPKHFDGFYTLAELMVLLGYKDRRCLKALIKKGFLPNVKTKNGIYVVPIESVKDMIAKMSEAIDKRECLNGRKPDGLKRTKAFSNRCDVINE